MGWDGMGCHGREELMLRTRESWGGMGRKCEGGGGKGGIVFVVVIMIMIM